MAGKRWIIYVLKDPRTGLVRYVGMTHHSKTRLSGHVYSVKRSKTHTAFWVRSLLRDGLKPLMEVVEEGEGDVWSDRERFWIAEYRRLGADLTNHTEGGEGTLGWSPTPEQRSAMGERAVRVHTGKKRSPEARANMAKAQKAYYDRLKAEGVSLKRGPRSKETLEKMSKAQTGKKHSAEARRKMSESSRKRELTPELREAFGKSMRTRTPEWKAWFAQSQKGKPKSAETKAKMSEAAKKRWALKKTLRCSSP